jgi:hypothetical protein
MSLFRIQGTNNPHINGQIVYLHDKFKAQNGVITRFGGEGKSYSYVVPIVGKPRLIPSEFLTPLHKTPFGKGDTVVVDSPPGFTVPPAKGFVTSVVGKTTFVRLDGTKESIPLPTRVINYDVSALHTYFRGALFNDGFTYGVFRNLKVDKNQGNKSLVMLVSSVKEAGYVTVCDMHGEVYKERYVNLEKLKDGEFREGDLVRFRSSSNQLWREAKVTDVINGCVRLLVKNSYSSSMCPTGYDLGFVDPSSSRYTVQHNATRVSELIDRKKAFDKFCMDMVPQADAIKAKERPFKVGDMVVDTRFPLSLVSRVEKLLPNGEVQTRYSNVSGSVAKVVKEEHLKKREAVKYPILKALDEAASTNLGEYKSFLFSVPDPLPTKKVSFSGKVESSGATKTDTGKIRFDLLPGHLVEPIAKVMTYGAEKYAPHNWMGLTPERLLAAFGRHMAAHDRARIDATMDEVLVDGSVSAEGADFFDNIKGLASAGYVPIEDLGMIEGFFDEESNLPHIDHALTCLLMYRHLLVNGSEPKVPQAKKEAA